MTAKPTKHRGLVRAAPPRPRSWKEAASSHPKIALGAVVLALALAWVFWPSRGPGLRNLDSRGNAVIAFGDSLTAGFGASRGEDYPSALARKSGVAIINAGVSGDTTESALERLEADVLAADPRIVIVGLGGNDFLRGVAIGSTEANLRTIVKRIQGEGAMVVLLGFEFPSLTVNYGAMYERVAHEEGCLFVPDLLDDIGSNPSLKSDAIHPNARGYALMADRVAGPLARLIRKADAAR